MSSLSAYVVHTALTAAAPASQYNCYYMDIGYMGLSIFRQLINNENEILTIYNVG